MTLLSRLGYCPAVGERISVPRHITAGDISIVIPVKDNQSGINRFLDRFIELTVPGFYPKEIIVIDNNSSVPVTVSDNFPFPVIVDTCSMPGPASARNTGLFRAKGEWVLFLDSDCIPTESTISGYLTACNTCVGYAGNINICTADPLSCYYSTQETLIPPHAIENGLHRPDYLVTANCLVYKKALFAIDGFDESFQQAGGEDIDLAFRLLEIGDLQYQWNSVVIHSFDDGVKGFISRFKRYGKGNRQLADKHKLNLMPKPFWPEHMSPINIILSVLQYCSMFIGYQFSGVSK